MRFVLSIILIVTLLVMIFYGFDFKEDFAEEDITQLKCCGEGMQGQDGAIGPNGRQGIQGITGQVGDQGFNGDKGNKGDKGLQGDRGPRGTQGIQGEQGVIGSIGPVGNSAYDAAYNKAILENPSPEWAKDTYDKDERIDMWRESLKGDQGITGQVSGVTGPIGSSAYNIAYKLEEKKLNDNRADWFNSGDKDEWLTSLTGEVGIMGGDGPQHNIPIGIIVAFHTLSINDPIPDGWRECDGNNGTPDLRGRFILGDESPRTTDTTEVKYVLGDVGGVEKHTLTDAEQNTPHTHPNEGNVKLRLSCQEGWRGLNAINDQGNPHLNTTVRNTSYRDPTAKDTNYYNVTAKWDYYTTGCSDDCAPGWTYRYWTWCGFAGHEAHCKKYTYTYTKCSGYNCPTCTNSGATCPLCSGNNCPMCTPGDSGGGCPGRDCSEIVKATSPKKYNTTTRISAAAVAHENMPPFYVLRYIMKV
jgi:microcystin-dependent protein